MATFARHVSASSDLSDYANLALLGGRSGGQTVYGGAGSAEDLTLHSTQDSTKGKIYLGATTYQEEANGRFVVGAAASPGGVLRLSNTNTNISIGEYGGQLEFYNHDASSGERVGAYVKARAVNAGQTYGLDFGIAVGASAATSYMTLESTALTISSTVINSGSPSSTSAKLNLAYPNAGLLFLERTGSSGNVVISFKNTAGTSYIGRPPGAFFGIGSNANLTSSPYFYIDTSGNIGFNQTSWGTSAVGVLAMSNGTAPSTSPADAFQMYSADQAAGNACPHFRTENSGIIKLFSTGTLYSTGGFGADLDTLDIGDGVDQVKLFLITLLRRLDETGIITLAETS